MEKTHKNPLDFLKDWRVDVAIFISLLALVASFSQACYMRQTLRVDQRPWINVSLLSQQIPMGDGKPITVPIRLLNMGKTPAKEVKAMVFVEYVKNGGAPDFDEVTRRPVPHSSITTGVIFPTMHADFEVSRKRFQSGSNKIEDSPMLPSENKDAIEGNSYLAVYGEVGYKDSFNVPHWTRFCNWLFAGPGEYTAAECVKRNDVDNNN